MIEPSLQIGGGNWANKSDSLLGYHKDGANFYADELTFSRNSEGSYTDANGLIQSMPYNLLQQSNSFSTTWVTSSATITGGQSGYDGTNNAWQLTSLTSGGNIYQSNTQNEQQTFSVYAKGSVSNGIRIYAFGGVNANVYFDLNNGNIGSIQGAGVTAAIESVSGGWYKCSISFNQTNATLRFYPSNNANAMAAGSIYIQDAQLNQGSTALPYFATTTRLNLARVDYKDNVNGSLLLEPQRTNLLTYSEQMDNAAWVKQDSSVTANSTTSPDGTQNADKLVENDQNQAHYIQANSGSFTAGSYCLSIFAKAGERSIIQLLMSGSVNADAYANFDLVNGVISASASSTATIQSFGNGWYRCNMVFTASSASSPLGFYCIQNSPTATRALNYLGNGTSGIYIYGAQLEQGSYSTSYIKSEGAATTRLADSCSGAGNSEVFNDSEGVLFIEAATLSELDITARYFQLSDGTITANGITFRYYTTTNYFQALYYTGGAYQAVLSVFLSDSSQFNKIAYKYKANDFALWVNGVKIGTDTSGNTGAVLSNLNFNNNGFDSFEGKTKQLLYFNEALSDTELATLTTI